MTDLPRIALAATLCLADWGAAASHMAFSRVEFRPFYARRLSIFGDVWHLVAGLRYLVMGAAAVLGFGWAWQWYIGTALVNALGWLALKALHGKLGAWGWRPRWLKQIPNR